MSASDKVELDKKVADLTERLEDAQSLLLALSEGRIDAVVVGTDEDKKRVLMLSGAYGRYRQLVEDMRQGAVTVTRDGEIIFANRSFASLVKVSQSELFRKPLRQFVKAAERMRLETLLGRHSGRQTVEVSMVRSDGTTRPASITLVADNDEFTTMLINELGADGAGEQTKISAPAIEGERPSRSGDVSAELRVIVGPLRQAVETLKAANALAPDLRRAVDVLDRETLRLLALLENPPREARG